MTFWGAAAGTYGLILAAAALTQPIERRIVAFAATLAYALAAFGVGSLVDVFWVNLLAPGALLLTGYWLSGFFFRDPQAWLEGFLLRTDWTLGAEKWMRRLPRMVREVLELSYALDYVVIGGGAIYAATFGTEAVDYYWSLVLAAELASFAPMPWLRSRPPRVLEVPGTLTGQCRPNSTQQPPPEDAWHPQSATAAPYLQRLNTAILDRASVQANTLPSGHVSGAVAAALGVWAVDPALGAGMMVMAGVIAIAAIAGRYHYVVDCAAGAIVAAAFWSLI